MAETAKKFLDLEGLGIVVGKIMDGTVHSVNGKKGVVTLSKSDVGLANVTNDAQVKRSEMGVAGGVATLDSGGKVPAAQLPSYVDDVLEFENTAAFPIPGESGKIYVDKDTNNTYRWGGTSYTEISKSLALGETSSTAYAGDKGKKNAEDIAAVSNTVDEIFSTVTDLTTNVDELSGNLNGVSNTLSSVSGDIDDINSWRLPIVDSHLVTKLLNPSATASTIGIGVKAVNMDTGAVVEDPLTLPAATATTAGVMTAAHAVMLADHDTKITALESKEPESITAGEINALFVS